MNTVCTHCGKSIKGPMIYKPASILEIQLGIAKNEAYHPSCHKKSEKL